jgi:poly(hydroxyalkanoate) depolymerase family esterase
MPQAARYLRRSFTCDAGTRDFRLYLPACQPDNPRGLIVMLHGCTQNPEDFATGTGMNALAEQYGLSVAWPEQTRAHNASACWNWFRPGDQSRDAGEPAILAGITRQIAAEFNVPDNRTFAAGLSSGGAMAAILGETWPDLFSAIGVHSGLPPGCAGDVVSAFAAMRGDARPAPRCARAADASRLIVFHGSADRTVHPSNGERLFEAARGPRNPQDHRATAPGGRDYTRSRTAGPDGSIQAEYWLIEGTGHAWSGGQAGGSHTDPTGPDASKEMLRFFLNTPE